ncbi:MAG: DUF1003 domain-containing protein [Chloroflexi bacterium]|nr:DUF1003 domain-containing protein [Chloroflexota bacterium]
MSLPDDGDHPSTNGKQEQPVPARRYSVQTRQCQICGRRKPTAGIVPAALVRSSVVETIKGRHPNWNEEGYICLQDLTMFRFEHVEEIVQEEKGDQTTLEQSVLEGLRNHEVLTRDLNAEYDNRRTLGERVADRIAAFGGSWKFIGIFSVVLAVWVSLNAVNLFARPFDPYPFILLNLVLSALAAIQAPVIMMSQNRQEARDRLRAENEYRVSLKAELEIRLLTEKVDHLIAQQWQRLLEIQKIQLDMLGQMRPRQPRRNVSINDVLGRPN